MSTHGNVLRRGWWNNVPKTQTTDVAYFEDDSETPKTLDQLIADWESIRRLRIDLEAEVVKVAAQETRCVTAINDELKRLGVPRT